MDDIDEWISQHSGKNSKQEDCSIDGRCLNENVESDIKIPQVDGADDILRTPTKRADQKISRYQTKSSTPQRSPKTNNSSPTRSPRTPKLNASTKYAPLPLLVTNHSANS